MSSTSCLPTGRLPSRSGSWPGTLTLPSPRLPSPAPRPCSCRPATSSPHVSPTPWATPSAWWSPQPELGFVYANPSAAAKVLSGEKPIPSCANGEGADSVIEGSALLADEGSRWVWLEGASEPVCWAHRHG